MEDRRYPEGAGTIPALNIPGRNSMTDSEKIAYKRRNYLIIPTAVSGNLSGTSDAKKCFVERRFSEKFQQFMLNYSYTLVTSKVLSGEI